LHVQENIPFDFLETAAVTRFVELQQKAISYNGKIWLDPIVGLIQAQELISTK